MPQQGDLDINGMLLGVAERARVREGVEGVRAVIRALRQGVTLGTRDLAEAARLPIPLVAAIRGELKKLGLVEKRPRGTGLTDEGERVVAELFGQSGFESQSAATDDTASTLKRDNFAEDLASLVSRRPDADVTLDQAKATSSTLARRVEYLAQTDAISGRHILFLGDDDFTSAAVAVWIAHEKNHGRDVSAQSVVALDIDERIVSELNTFDGIETRLWDARDPVPDDIAGAFDVVITDPPYTLAGVELFLSRAIEAVGGRIGSHVYLSLGHLDPDAMRNVQSSISEMGWVVAEWRPGFNAYDGASVLAGTSLISHLILASDSAPVITGRYDGPMYTADTRSAVRAYRCRECHISLRVGPGERWSTIAVLKRSGCPECSAERFDRLSSQQQVELERSGKLS
jgi:N4-bis(aminopropyl)spermidine synthase